ncbi:MAG: GGDEF domain-containing protein [Myxococcota bacterium]
MAEARSKDSEVLSTLFEVTRHLNEGADIEKVLGVIAEAAHRLSSADSASVLLLDEHRQRLLCRASHGLTTEEADVATFQVGEGLAGWVAAEGRSLRLEEASSDPRFKKLPGQERSIRGFCSVPLSGREGVIGVMTVTSVAPAAFDESDEAILSYLAASVVKDVENARLYRLAVTDALTGVYNRQFLSERLPAELERHRRYGQPLTIGLVDADHFKAINDEFGHPAGDAVLRVLAHRCQEAVREIDPVVRYGGEEFMLILPQTDRAGGGEAAERLRRRVADEPIPWDRSKVRLTVSLGVAEMEPGDLEPKDLIARADAALYAAKKAGRNRVEVAT